MPKPVQTNKRINKIKQLFLVSIFPFFSRDFLPEEYFQNFLTQRINPFPVQGVTKLYFCWILALIVNHLNSWYNTDNYEIQIQIIHLIAVEGKINGFTNILQHYKNYIFVRI